MMSENGKRVENAGAIETWRQCGYSKRPTVGASSQARAAAKLKIALATSKLNQPEARKMTPVAASGDGWLRETHVVSRREARQKTQEFFRRFPRNSFLVEIESWRVLEDERIEFVLRSHPK